jgi:hypothetical protein
MHDWMRTSRRPREGGDPFGGTPSVQIVDGKRESRKGILPGERRIQPRRMGPGFRGDDDV